jgi:hypothetical protein
MATYAAHIATHQTLTANTADTVTLDVYGRYIEIVHRGSATNPIYFCVGRSPAAPTVAGNDTLIALSTKSTVVPWPVDSPASLAQIKLISAGAEPYSVQVLPDRLA